MSRSAGVVISVFILSCVLFAVDACEASKEDPHRSPQRVGALCDAVKNESPLQFNDCTVVSPNKAMAACLKTDQLTKNEVDITHLYLEREGKLIKLAEYEELGPSWKPVWSPDSAQFALTYTDGGAACCWYVEIFNVETGKHHAISYFVQKDMATHRKCEFSNTYFSRWLDANTANIWVEGREPSKKCSRGENDQAYRVDVRTGRILKRYSAKETKQIEDFEE